MASATTTTTTSGYITCGYTSGNTTAVINSLDLKSAPVTQNAITFEDCLAALGHGSIVKPSKSLTVVDVRILAPGKVVAVTFDDGATEKAVCHESDEFSLETGIAVCLAKHAMGGSSEYNKAVKKAVKVYEDKLAKEKAEAEEKARREKRRAKHQAYIKRREEKKREGRIEEMAEAYRRAMGN